jgi:hypothetical protein
MKAIESLLVRLDKRSIDDLLVRFDLHIVGSRMEDSGYLLFLEGEPYNLCEFIVEVVNMEFFLSEALNGEL